MIIFTAVIGIPLHLLFKQQPVLQIKGPSGTETIPFICYFNQSLITKTSFIKVVTFGTESL